jgi:phosphatidylethanolamine/phosphatidyl-N-methylethanolamine N-methyltransferase
VMENNLKKLTDLSANDYDYWSRFAKTYDDDNIHIIGSATNDAVREWLLEQFEECDTVLEIGCGNGFTSRMIAGCVGSLMATDMSSEMLKEARKKLKKFKNVRLRLDDCYSPSLKQETFDCVLFANVIHIVRDPVRVLMAAHELLKESGRLIVIDYTSHGLTAKAKKAMMSRYMDRWGPVPIHSFAASQENLKELVESAGFEVEEATLVGDISKAVCLRGRKV